MCENMQFNAYKVVYFSGLHPQGKIFFTGIHMAALFILLFLLLIPLSNFLQVTTNLWLLTNDY